MNISESLTDLLDNSPFIKEALDEGLINVSALARKLRPEIEMNVGQKLSDAALIMAINRRPHGSYEKLSRNLREVFNNLGDVIVRSDLSNFTYQNSRTLIACQRLLMDEIDQEKDLFIAWSQGVYESTIIISRAYSSSVERIFGNEKLLAGRSGLSAMTIRLPQNNTEVPGIYYHILKNLAWSGVNIVEVISTSNEFSIVVDDSLVTSAFSVLMKLKTRR